MSFRMNEFPPHDSFCAPLLSDTNNISHNNDLDFEMGSIFGTGPEYDDFLSFTFPQEGITQLDSCLWGDEILPVNFNFVGDDSATTFEEPVPVVTNGNRSNDKEEEPASSKQGTYGLPWRDSIVIFSSKPGVQTPTKSRKRFESRRKKEVALNRLVGACVQCKLRKEPVRRRSNANIHDQD